jgi:tetratricopeptide (TPR) repeat protein
MQNTRPLAFFTTFAVALFLAVCTAVPARAQKPSQDPAYQRAVLQSDGIVNKVVDELWETTDHYWHEGDYHRVISIIRICVEADPTFTEAYSVGAWLIWSLGDIQTADAFLKYGLAHAPKAQQADMCYELGWQLYNTKRYTNALPYLQKAVALGAKNRLAYTILAHCYTRLKRYDESIATWKQVIKRYPDFQAAPKNLETVEKLKSEAAGG